MAERKLKCEVVTPEKILYSGEVRMVIAPGESGELGILPLHTPLITTLKPGELVLKYSEKGEQDYIAIDGGFLEVSEDSVIVLADGAEFVSKIDIERLKQHKSELEEKLKQLKREEDEFFIISDQLAKITNRLSLAHKRR